MAEIPAPLLNRHTATAIVVVTVLAVAVSIASVVVPIDEASPLWLAALRFVVLAAHAAVLALGVFLAWRTLATRSRTAAAGGVLGVAGFLLLALVELLAILGGTAWGVPAVVLSLGFAGGVAFGLVLLGLVPLGVAVLRRGTAPAAGTALVTGGALVVPLAVLLLVDDVLPTWVVGIAYPLWSLVFLVLAAGLRTRREVPAAGVPDTHLGAAQV